MKTLSLDLRRRIVESYDEGTSTQAEVAKRFRVSLGMVKKLIQQRRRTGQIEARHRFSGRKASLLPDHGQELKALVGQHPDLTLAEIKERLDLGYTVGAIHWALDKLGLTYKKRHSMPPSKTAPISRKPASAGSAAKADSTRRGSCSSTSRRPRRT